MYYTYANPLISWKSERWIWTNNYYVIETIVAAIHFYKSSLTTVLTILTLSVEKPGIYVPLPRCITTEVLQQFSSHSWVLATAGERCLTSSRRNKFEIRIGCSEPVSQICPKFNKYFSCFYWYLFWDLLHQSSNSFRFPLVLRVYIFVIFKCEWAILCEGL